jgi:hypothetical protein
MLIPGEAIQDRSRRLFGRIVARACGAPGAGRPFLTLKRNWFRTTLSRANRGSDFPPTRSAHREHSLKG